ncbi:3-hydroxy-3-methylglutaryl-CoA reductase [Candidatus Woesearchaeota archaeon]|nr:3-hydroxy-3-methylglutaryl-CoA reductase [Candidatus Woesearchaeota archaeon]
MDIEAVKKEIIEKNIPLYELEEYFLNAYFNDNLNHVQESCELAEQIRALLLEESQGISLSTIKKSSVPTYRVYEQHFTKGIEMKIGGVVIPVGVGGPVIIHGQHAKGSFYVPLATNEAALLAGLQRGFKTVNTSGGVQCIVKDNSMTRAPLFEASSIHEAQQVCWQINCNPAVFELFREIVKEKASYTQLKSIKAYQLSNKIWLRICFNTGAAMGMNSAVKYTQAIVQLLLDDFPNLKLLSISGNLCTDKKASHINILEGRGTAVESEVMVQEQTLKEIYGDTVTGAKLEKLNHWKNYVGSGLSGTLTGFNANAANTVAGIFAATGQDLAQLPESTACFTHAEQTEQGIRFGVSLPNLEVGVVGGGTGYGTARECLSLLGCLPNNVLKFAEIIGAAVLAQELNLLCTLLNHFELGESHLVLARGEKQTQLQKQLGELR